MEPALKFDDHHAHDHGTHDPEPADLLLDSGFVFPFERFFRKPQNDAVATQANPTDVLRTQYGISVTEKDGQYQYTYRADGQDRVALTTPATPEALQGARNQLDSLAIERVNAIEAQYHVQFARPGEKVTRAWERDQQCVTSRGEMIHAAQPTLAQLHAVEHALKVSEPSQFNSSGSQGIKIYFLDKQPMPPVYGGKPVLGMYMRADKDDRIALYMTPDGAKLPPMASDVPPGGNPTRNLAWGVAHELTHNSQNTSWESTGRAPQWVGESLGWKKVTRTTQDKAYSYDAWLLEGKNGELFTRGSVGCNSPDAWYRVNEQFQPVDKVGNVVASLASAPKFTNEEVMDAAKVRPVSYYFANPTEMLSEALTAYRMGGDVRESMRVQSPSMFAAAERYDKEEIAKFYGVDATGQPTHARGRDGSIAEIASAR